ncbi:MAG TPA: Spy/CpxP family protein refolding chaperone [Rhizomicrobium sp.]
MRKMLFSACISGALFAGGAISHALAADAPRAGMAGTFDPVEMHKQVCTDHFARDAGRVAYIEAKLSLTDSQRPLFDNWKQTVLDSAKSRESECLARRPPAAGDNGPSVLVRQARMAQRLQRRFAELTTEQPSLSALYASLSPEQKQVFDRPAGGHGLHGGWRDHGPQGDAPDAAD